MNEQLSDWIFTYSWIIPALPLTSFLINGLILRPLAEKTAGVFATVMMGGAWVAALFVGYQYFSLPTRPTFTPWSFEWLRFQEGFSVQFGCLLDPLSVLMLVVVTTVSFWVHFYSLGYMRGESGYGRYYSYLGFFTFSMLGLTIAPNLFQTYFFWELVGASSFLLIGFYYARPAAVSAAKKAFIVTRFADLGFFLGILLLGGFGYSVANQIHSSMQPLQTLQPLQPLDFAFLNDPNVLRILVAQPILGGFNVLSVAMLLVFMGAAGKSAMFPLHIWLPDAMEGPTPVSALIHAATMVVAGVFLVARLFPAFAAAPGALSLISTVGLFTSAFAALIACTQDDLKRVLAFSTLSQLGLMMLALGLASPASPLGYSASMFHLFTHAFFKALLFLGAGSLIHATHSNDVWKMGGLRRALPVTHLTFAIAVLAIAGIWPFSGFFSKDEILLTALRDGNGAFFAGVVLVGGFTAFYMGRVYFLAFWGAARSEGADHAHEAPWTMLLPLVFLAALSATSGFVPFSDFVRLGGESLAHEGIDLAVAIPATLAALLGLGLSMWTYANPERGRSFRMASVLGSVYRMAKGKFYVDEVYLFVTHRLIFRFVAAPIARFDRKVVDGGVNLTGSAMRSWSDGLLGLQTGQLQTYLIWLFAGALATSIAFWATWI